MFQWFDPHDASKESTHRQVLLQEHYDASRFGNRDVGSHHVSQKGDSEYAFK